MITETKKTKKRKKKKYANSVSITTGDIDYNIRQFNKRMGTDFPGNDNNNPSTAENDSDSSASAGTEIGGMSESMKINEATKREIKRYYIRPQNIFCSTKTDILKALADSKDKNCSVYSLKRLEDHDDVHKLTNNDIIYYYDNNVLYDKNHVQVLDYDLYVKHEEERPHLDVDEISDSEFTKNYDDRMTVLTKKDDTIKEALTESQAQEISREYKILNRMYGVDIEELVYGKDGFMQSRYPEGFKDFAGDIIYNKKY